MLDVAVSVDGDWPIDADSCADLSSRAVAAAFLVTPHGELAHASVAIEVSVRFASDDEMQRLNAAYRQRDSATNVLSFPMVPADLLGTLVDTDDGEVLFGDIVLADGVYAREAAEKGISLADHAAHLLVHGTLHLLGYDHESEVEAEAMEAIEVKALASMGIAAPYSPQPM